MSEKTSTTVTYTPLESGNEESRWIRLEQVQATLPSPSVGYMAELIDLVFKREACDDGMGGGGEEADEQNEPTDEDFAEQLSIVLTETGNCRQGYWLGAVNVYRTHEQPGYELRSETAKVETVEPRRESYLQVVDVNGPLIALERPYAGNLQGIPKNVNWTVRGATVNLDRPVRDRLTLRYDTWHEYVTLRVPTKRTEDGEEYEPAAVVAFWGDMAAECQLEPPEPEDPENQAALDNFCREKLPERPEPVGCWKTVHHYKRCNCSYSVIDEWDEKVGVPCDGASAGSRVGYEEKFDGFDRCEGEEDEELRDPEYYKKRCCRYPTKSLPTCRTSYAIYSGGEKIENGPEHWKAFYGDNVRMIAVLPESGVCGEQITEWNVPQRNCCDGVEPLRPDPNNPTEILYPYPISYGVQAMGGKADVEWTWKTTGGLKIWQTKTTEWRVKRSAIGIYFEEGVCPNPTVEVTDGCSKLVMRFQGPESEPPQLNITDLALSSDEEFGLRVGGGVPGYMWMATGGIEMMGYSASGEVAWFRTPSNPDDWCIGTVTVVDACGRESTCTVRNADKGRWVRQYDFDPCNPPVRGGQYESPPQSPGGWSFHWTLPRDGYRMQVQIDKWGLTSECAWPSGYRFPCDPGTFVSDGGQSFLPTYCAWAYPQLPGGADISCGCRYEMNGSDVFVVISESVLMIEKWVCS